MILDENCFFIIKCCSTLELSLLYCFKMCAQTSIQQKKLKLSIDKTPIKKLILYIRGCTNNRK